MNVEKRIGQAQGTDASFESAGHAGYYCDISRSRRFGTDKPEILISRAIACTGIPLAHRTPNTRLGSVSFINAVIAITKAADHLFVTSLLFGGLNIFAALPCLASLSCFAAFHRLAFKNVQTFCK